METEKEIEYTSTILEMRNIIERIIQKNNVYNKERYEQNKEEILKYRRERYRTIHKKDLILK